MKALSEYVSEQFLIGNDDIKIQNYDYHPTTKNELIDIVSKKINNVNDKTQVIDLNNIDTSKITDFSFLFYQKPNLIKIDVSDWEMQKAKNINCMFAGCINLESIGDISGWEVKNLKYMKNAFSFCKKLTDVGDLEKWKVNPSINTDNAFSKSGLKTPSWVQEKNLPWS